MSLSSDQSSVGLVGVGLLGLSLAQRLIQSGFPVRGWDVSKSRLVALRQSKGESAIGIEDVFRRCRHVVLSLPDSGVVHSVLETASLSAGQVIVDTTTGDPLATEATAAALAGRGVLYLDATILGSSELAACGEAIALVGATDEGLRESKDILQSISREYFHLGPPGSGAKMKLVANLVLGLHRAVLAEGLAFARGYGIDLVRAIEVLKSGATYSRVMDTKGVKMTARDFPPQARLRQHLKDVELIRKESKRLGALVPLSELHFRLLNDLVERGFGDEDNSAIIRAYDR